MSDCPSRATPKGFARKRWLKVRGSVRHLGGLKAKFANLGFALLALCVTAFIPATVSAQAQSVRLLLNRPFDASAAPYLGARNELRQRKIDLNVADGTTSKDTIQKLAAGKADIAVADLSALIQYRLTTGALPIKAVFVVFDRAPQSIIARRSRGITEFADLAGKKIGITEGGLSKLQWTELAKRNSIDPTRVTLENISQAVREPLLSAGQVDAIAGQSFSAPLNLKDRGVPAADLIVFRMADYGFPAYGDVVIVNPDFAAGQPETVKAFLEALTAAIKQAAKKPQQAVDIALSQIDGGNRDLEIERLKSILGENILTLAVRQNGLGGADDARLAEAIAFETPASATKTQLAPADIFDSNFLPTPAKRGTK